MKNRTQIPLILLILLAYSLRVYCLACQSLWIDEGWTVYFSQLSMPNLATYLRTTEPHPPLYFPLINLWTRLVGESEFALRYYSLIFSLLAIPLTYRLSRLLADTRTALLAMLLMTVAPFQIWHAQEARMYAQLTALSLLSMITFLRFRTMPYLLATAAAILTHYHGLVIVGIQGLTMLLWAEFRLLKRFVRKLALLSLLLAPWFWFSWDLLKARTSWLEQPTLWESLSRSLIAYGSGPTDLAWLALPFLLLYLLGLLMAVPRQRGLLLSYTIAPIIATWLYGELRPNSTIYLERYLIVVQPAYLLTIALAFSKLTDLPGKLKPRFATRKGLPDSGWLVSGGMLLIIMLICGWQLQQHYHNPAYAKANWRAVARYISQFEQPGDGIILTGDGGQLVFDYYYRGNLPRHLDFHTPMPPPETTRQIITTLTERHTRLWYLPYEAPIDMVIENSLHESAYPAWQRWLGGKRLALYRSSMTNLTTIQPLDSEITADLRLKQLEWPQQATPAGDVLPLRAQWQTHQPTAQTVGVSLRLRNQQGDLFAQSDWPPLTLPPGPTAVTSRHGLWLPVDLPPGEYVINMVLYELSSGQSYGPPLTLPAVQIGPPQITPPLSALDLPNRTQRSLGPVDLVGYALPATVRPGESLWAWLYWQCRYSCETPRPLRLALSGHRGVISQPLGGPGWQADQVRRHIYHLPTSPRLAERMLEISLSLPEQPQTVRLLVPLTHRQHQLTPPPVGEARRVDFGGQIALVGYDLQQQPGQLSLTLHWQAVAEMTRNYTVFVQLLDAANRVVTQVNRPPHVPTRTWLPGEFISERYQLAAPPGQYRLIGGWYEPSSGARLPRPDSADDFVTLTTLTME